MMTQKGTQSRARIRIKDGVCSFVGSQFFGLLSCTDEYPYEKVNLFCQIKLYLYQTCIQKFHFGPSGTHPQRKSKKQELVRK